MNLVIMDCIYYIEKYKDYTRLIKAFENHPELVIKDKTAHRIILDLASGTINMRRGKTLTPEGDARREYLINRVYAYEFFGFQQYSSENDSKKIADGETPSSAVGRTYCWYEKNRQNYGFLTYETIKGYVKKANTQNKQKIFLGIESHLVSIYDEEKEDINILKAKNNAKGTYLDEEIFPEFWEELLRVF